MTRRERLIDVTKCMLNRVRDDEVSALGAQLTYYLILSFFPFLIFLISIISFFQLSGDEVIWEWISILPEAAKELITRILSEVSGNKSQTLLSVGMIATLWAASNGINAIIKGLNRAYDVEENRAFWKVRGISILSTLVLAVVILLSMGMVIFGRAIGEYLFRFMTNADQFDRIWAVMQYTVPVAAMLAVFTLLFWITPNRRLRIREVIPGAIFTTIGWIAISLVFSFYVNRFGNYTRTYGSLGGVIVLLIWLYISSIMVILGGQLNATLAFSREGRVKPECKAFGWSFPWLKKWLPKGSTKNPAP
ncbi:YihY/virulence factor BrkB family protein [Paenibacillus sp. HJGM_3]|uniref:YihY/virulence factor BrkB family protein n=1 Tax=Paenibacillus sp. HJGM_3 TaxID=3379816 RepID=UPI00385E5C54